MQIKIFDYKFKTQKPSKKEGFLVCTHNYIFFNQLNKKYIVKINEFEEDLFYVSFYMQGSRVNKYSVLTNDGYLKTKVYTCLDICYNIYKQNPTASFCFIGAATLKEIKEDSRQTKRFRIYRRLVSSYFYRYLTDFNLIYDENNCFMLLANKKADTKKLSELINNCFDNFD